MSEFGLGRRPRRPDGQRDTGETEQEGKVKEKEGDPSPAVSSPPKKDMCLPLHQNSRPFLSSYFGGAQNFNL